MGCGNNDRNHISASTSRRRMCWSGARTGGRIVYPAGLWLTRWGQERAGTAWFVALTTTTSLMSAGLLFAAVGPQPFRNTTSGFGWSWLLVTRKQHRISRLPHPPSCPRIGYGGAEGGGRRGPVSVAKPSLRESSALLTARDRHTHHSIIHRSKSSPDKRMERGSVKACSAAGRTPLARNWWA